MVRICGVFSHSSVEGHQGSFLAILNKVDEYLYSTFCVTFSFLHYKSSEMQLLYQKLITHLVLQEIDSVFQSDYTIPSTNCEPVSLISY